LETRIRRQKLGKKGSSAVGFAAMEDTADFDGVGIRADEKEPVVTHAETQLAGLSLVGGIREERFLSTQADAFAGANAEEKVGLLLSK
jgi:hypothetical protein